MSYQSCLDACLASECKIYLSQQEQNLHGMTFCLTQDSFCAQIITCMLHFQFKPLSYYCKFDLLPRRSDVSTRRSLSSAFKEQKRSNASHVQELQQQTL